MRLELLQQNKLMVVVLRHTKLEQGHIIQLVHIKLELVHIKQEQVRIKLVLVMVGVTLYQ